MHEGCRTYNLESLKKECTPKQYECREVPTKCEEPCEKPVTVCCEKNTYGAHYIGGLIILWVIIAIVLYFVQPNFIFVDNKNRNCEDKNRRCEDEDSCGEDGRRGRCVNWGALILWSLVIALVILVLVWLFRTFAQGFQY